MFELFVCTQSMKASLVTGPACDFEVGPFRMYFLMDAHRSASCPQLLLADICSQESKIKNSKSIEGHSSKGHIRRHSHWLVLGAIQGHKKHHEV